MGYIDTLHKEIQDYFKILSKSIPNFILDYIETPEMQRLAGISLSCGLEYTRIFGKKFSYTKLDHSIGVALIIWNFTHNKKKTLSGLFHDIATPCFAHCIDYMHNDYLKQESTEAGTEEIIRKSKDIRKLLDRDGVNIEDILDYNRYSIANNDAPKLCADRLEYTLSYSLAFIGTLSLEDINKIYKNIRVAKNEISEPELCFDSKDIAEFYIECASKMWLVFISNADKLVMKCYADIVKVAIKTKVLTEYDLYTNSENHIIDVLSTCNVPLIKNAILVLRKATKIYEGDYPPYNNYHVHLDPKIRYTNPYVANYGRIYELSPKSKDIIDNILKFDAPYFAWFNKKINTALGDTN